MRQLVQAVRDGTLRVVDVPDPQISATEVLVRTGTSLVSAGTEKAIRELASGSLLAKAKARPDLVRQVLKKARVEGTSSALRTVRSRLAEEMPLGYSAAGRVEAVGEAVDGVRPGDRVATGGAGHAELQVVSGMLTVPIPDGVGDESAAFATVGAIALNGLRLAKVGPGSRVVVLGLGLVGQIMVRLARSAGCLAAGIDVREWSVERATGWADLSLVDQGDETTAAIVDWARGRGVDAVLVTAATDSSEPMRRAPSLLRDRGTIVVVGDVGLDLDRRPLYDKEIQLRVSRSYGPGRYEPSYEDLGIDHPIGQVRWTEGRNLEAFLDLLATGQLVVEDLITHRFAFDDVLDAYALIEDGTEPYLGIQLAYGEAPVDRPEPSRTEPASGPVGIGLIGAGSFARGVLVPALQEAGFAAFARVTSARGLSAQNLVDRGPFERAAAGPEALIDDPAVGTVVIATPHDAHADLTVKALARAKPVFCEKPLALDHDELGAVIEAWRQSGCCLFVGFNRRFSPAVVELQDRLRSEGGPLMITYRVHAGPVPDGHWYGDRRQGGRLLGEVCHFIDTCAAIVARPVASVYATGSGRSEALLDPDLMVVLRFADGSQAAITYASSGHPSTSKERVEVLGRGHTAVIDDFTVLTVDGKRAWRGSQDKGHRELARRFRAAVGQGGDDDLTTAFVASTAATLAAAASLLTGSSEVPRGR